MSEPLSETDDKVQKNQQDQGPLRVHPRSSGVCQEDALDNCPHQEERGWKSASPQGLQKFLGPDRPDAP